jgi:hypothetical protein
MRDERDPLVPERSRGGFAGQLRQVVELGDLGGDQSVVARQRRGRERLPVLEAAGRERAVDGAVA